MPKNYTSKTLRTTAYLWISLPLTYLALAGTIMAIPLSGIVKIALNPWYWFVSAIAITSALGLLKLRWYGWYMFIFSNVIVVYQTAVALVHYSASDARFVIWIWMAAAESLIIYIVGRAIRVPYFFPKIRWWESDPRYKLSVQVKISRNGANNVEGEIMDLSLGGCFVKTHSYFAPDEAVELSFTLFDCFIACKGRVVWRTESTVTHPKGVGIKFEALKKETVLTLKQVTQKLKKMARAYTQMSRERNWQEYLQREQRYQGKTSTKTDSAAKIGLSKTSESGKM